MSNFKVSTVSADGLAPLGAGTSLGIMLDRIVCRIHTEPALEGLINLFVMIIHLNFSS